MYVWAEMLKIKDETSEELKLGKLEAKGVEFVLEKRTWIEDG